MSSGTRVDLSRELAIIAAMHIAFPAATVGRSVVLA